MFLIVVVLCSALTSVSALAASQQTAMQYVTPQQLEAPANISWRDEYVSGLLEGMRDAALPSDQILEPDLFAEGAAAPALPPVIDGTRLNMTPLRLLAILHAARNGHPNPLQAGALYITDATFREIAGGYWQSFKAGGDFVLPDRLSFLKPVLETAPKTDFVPFENGARSRLEACVAHASDVLPLLLKIITTGPDDLQDPVLSQALAKYNNNDC